jgi:hypothetical protein
VDRVVGKLRDRLLVPDERLEDVRQDAEERVGPSIRGQAERRGADRLWIRAVDDGADVSTDDPDAVARAEEGKVAFDDLVEQLEELGLDAELGGRLLALRLGDRVGAPAEDQAGVPIQVDLAKWVALDPPALETALVQSAAAEELGILVVGGQVLGAGGEEEKRLHGGNVPVEVGG